MTQKEMLAAMMEMMQEQKSTLGALATRVAKLETEGVATAQRELRSEEEVEQLSPVRRAFERTKRGVDNGNRVLATVAVQSARADTLAIVYSPQTDKHAASLRLGLFVHGEKPEDYTGPVGVQARIDGATLALLVDRLTEIGKTRFPEEFAEL